MGTYEFPWDMNQALSFALFRTYAVPSIGGLLASTGEFTERAQKRYDDTVLILDAVLEHGISSEDGRTAIRRMNQMHGSLRHQQRRPALRAGHLRRHPDPLGDAFGWRRMTERGAGRQRELLPRAGPAHGHPGHPGDLRRSSRRLLDRYEREHFGVRPGGRAVAEATLDAAGHVPAEQPPAGRASSGGCRFAHDGRPAARRVRLPAPVTRDARAGQAARSGPRPGGPVPAAAHRAVLRPAAPAGPQLPRRVRVAELGTFPPGCPVPHPRAAERVDLAARS